MEDRGNCMTGNFVTYVYNYSSPDTRFFNQLEADVMGGACVMYREKRNAYRVSGGKPEL
jgi:hypothetical protein